MSGSLASTRRFLEIVLREEATVVFDLGPMVGMDLIKVGLLQGRNCHGKEYLSRDSELNDPVP